MARITYKDIKPTAGYTRTEKLCGRDYCFEFKITDSITKTNFKSLMRVASKYDSKLKTGFIKCANQEEFLSIVEKAEKASDKVCKASHAKSIEKCKKITHSNECPDCGDHISFSGAHKCWESGLVY